MKKLKKEKITRNCRGRPKCISWQEKLQFLKHKQRNLKNPITDCIKLSPPPPLAKIWAKEGGGDLGRVRRAKIELKKGGDLGRDRRPPQKLSYKRGGGLRSRQATYAKIFEKPAKKGTFS